VSAPSAAFKQPHAQPRLPRCSRSCRRFLPLPYESVEGGEGARTGSPSLLLRRIWTSSRGCKGSRA